MNTDIVSIDAIIIEEMAEKAAVSVIEEPNGLPPETSLPARRRFGMVDLWKIRSKKRHFRNYQTTDSFSI
ncbi:MAG: hypothetical protein ACHQF0_05755 [Chitinophagales bacterium]